MWHVQEERVIKLHELGTALRTHFGGLAVNLVASTRGSAVGLVDAITAHLPGEVDTTSMLTVVERARA